MRIGFAPFTDGLCRRLVLFATTVSSRIRFIFFTLKIKKEIEVLIHCTQVGLYSDQRPKQNNERWMELNEDNKLHSNEIQIEVRERNKNV